MRVLSAPPSGIRSTRRKTPDPSFLCAFNYARSSGLPIPRRGPAGNSLVPHCSPCAAILSPSPPKNPHPQTPPRQRQRGVNGGSSELRAVNQASGPHTGRAIPRHNSAANYDTRAEFRPQPGSRPPASAGELQPRCAVLLTRSHFQTFLFFFLSSDKAIILAACMAILIRSNLLMTF